MIDGAALIEAYEQVAAEFYRETGMPAPGKDIPSAYTSDYRQGYWEAWHKMKGYPMDYKALLAESVGLLRYCAESLDNIEMETHTTTSKRPCPCIQCVVNAFLNKHEIQRIGVTR